MEKHKNNIYFLIYVLMSVMGLVFLYYLNQAKGDSYTINQTIKNVVIALISFYLFKFQSAERIIKFPFPKLKIPIFHIAVSFFLIVIVLIVGESTKGAVRRLNLFGFGSFQPSYYSRIVMIGISSYVISKNLDIIRENNLVLFLKKNYLSLIYVVTSGIVIFIEPHLSVLIITFLSIFLLFVIAGLRLKTILIMLLIVLIGVSAIFMLGKSYRFKRLRVYKKYMLINPYRDEVKVTADEERQVKESLIAISCGKLFGNEEKFTNTLKQYVSESNTDYIFTLICDVSGFIVAVLVLALYAFLLFGLLIRSFKIEDVFYRYFAMGLCFNLIITVVVNTGVAISVLPSTGVSLPFISYGGTAFLFDSLSLVLILKLLELKDLEQE